MNKYKIVFLLIWALNLQAQSQKECSTFLDKTEFKAGYYGTLLFDNGLNIGAEYLWKEKKKIKEKENGQKVTTHQLLINSSIGYSTNFSNQSNRGLYTHFGLIYRRTGTKRWQLNVALNPLGYYRAFLPETFEVKDGTVSKVKFPGRNYYAPSFAIGIGKLRKNKRRSGWYLNMHIAFRTPYNGGFLPNISFQYGQRFNFKKKKK